MLPGANTLLTDESIGRDDRGRFRTHESAGSR
jgi:hypothetical protein